MQLARNVYELYTKTSLTLDALVTQLKCWFLEVSGFKVELASDIDMRARRPNFGRTQKVSACLGFKLQS